MQSINLRYMSRMIRVTSVGSRHGLRFHSTKVAIIGSGPAGFYTAHHLLKKNANVEVDIFEKLPVPYGLSRYGVAPDHPEVKNCQDTFKELGNLQNFKFFGNVTVGHDISLSDLKNNYNCVVFSYGCDDDNINDFHKIPGFDEAKGILSARKFVGWYNGLPLLRDFNPPLEDAENVTIIGNGNVALDVARALLQPVEIWKKTDMPQHAISKLSKSNVKHVRIVGRRGLLESAFTNKELRELLELRKYGVIFNLLYAEDFKDIAPMASSMGRIHKRRLDLITKAIKKNETLEKEDIKKVWLLEYLKSAVEITPSPKSPKLLESVTFVKNELIQKSPTGPIECIPTSQKFTYKTDLLITSTGYKGTPIPGFEDLNIYFDRRRGTVGNIDGRLVSASNKTEILKGFYASGWIAIGAKGVIMSTMMNGFQTADLILEDLPIYENELKPGSQGIETLLADKSARFVSWRDWEKIENYEFKKGHENGKVREKICDVNEMLQILDESN